MKKGICFILTVFMFFSLFSATASAGYTLPEKIQRQLEVGSGLKGSFVIHCNADSSVYPFLSAVQNAEYEIRGIRYGDNLHYYFYQPGEGEERLSLTEYCKIDGTGFLRSDLLGETVYRIPEMDGFINSALNAEGENPPVIPDLIRMILSDEQSGDDAFNTESLEKTIEVWISAFSSETTIESIEGSSPRLSQVFRIPVESLFNMITEIVQFLSSNDTVMESLRAVFTEEQISTYLNPNLGYYYLDAMKNLDLKGDIVFSRTMSTLGELIYNTLVLPLDDSKTGFSSVTLKSDQHQKSILLTGTKGTYFLELPIDFDLQAESFDESAIRLIRINPDNQDHPNLALRISVAKTQDKYEDDDETRNHETDRYTFHITRDLSFLPENVSAELIPDMEPVDGEIEIHYSSKLQLSSPTTMDVSCKVLQGEYNFTLTGQVKTASPWTFSPFEVTDAVQTDSYTKEDLEKILDEWIQQASEKIIRTPEEISLIKIDSAAETETP